MSRVPPCPNPSTAGTEPKGRNTSVGLAGGCYDLMKHNLVSVAWNSRVSPLFLDKTTAVKTSAPVARPNLFHQRPGGCRDAADTAGSECAASANPCWLSQSWALILKFKGGAAHLHICDFMPHVIIHHYTKALERETIWENCGCARTLSSLPLKTANFSGFF